ncbi:MAG: heparinase II/III family protein [Sedimentisphaeraceae bacterium JB056]
MKYRIQLFSIWLLLIVFGFSAQANISKSANFQNEYKIVFDLLDLTQPELKEVKQAYEKEDYDLAAQELLRYYRSRSTVKGIVDKSDKQQALGKPLGETDTQWASNALERKLVGQKSYPAYFLGKDIDWLKNPVSDKEWIWQLHRMYWWPSMGKAYWSSGDEKYAAEWVFQLLDWIEDNPCVEDEKIAWRPLEVGSRLRSWANIFQYFVSSPEFTPKVLMQFLKSYHEQAEYVTKNYSAIGNHALFEAQGVIYAGVCFYEFKDAPSWRESAIGLFNKEIKLQAFDDGMHFELSPSYHSGAINTFLNAFTIAGSNGYTGEFPESYSDTIEKMIVANYVFSLPDFTVAQFGDAWKGGQDKLSNYFRKWADAYDRDDFLYFATKGSEGKAPQQTSIALKNGGFYTMRNGWGQNATAMILKCGPEGYFHAQPDNGSFELYAKGRHFMPDSGCFIYSGNDKERNWFRRTASHQTLTLNNENIACKPNLLLWNTSDELDVLVIENQSYKDLKHRRAVFFNKDFFVIVDDAIGKAEGDLRLHYAFEPCKAVFEDLAARTDFEQGANLLVAGLPQGGLTLEQEDGWVSYEYGKKTARPAFAYSIHKSTQDAVRFVTVVLPYETLEVPQVSIESLSEAGGKHAEVSIAIDSEEYVFTYDLENQKADVDKKSALKWIDVSKDKSVEVNGLAWFEYNDGAFVRLPLDEEANITHKAWVQSLCPSTARVRFKTDSTSMRLKINHGQSNPDSLDMYHMSSVGVSGIDLYIGGVKDPDFWKVTRPQKANGVYEHVYFENLPKKIRQYTLYLPTYIPLKSLEIGLDVDCEVLKPDKYLIEKPIVVYGTSITQSGCSSRGSNGYVAQIGRRLGADVVNLGFSGSGCSEPEVAKLIAEIDASVYIFDQVANMTPELMDNRYEKFVSIVRDKRPETPIILMTKPHYAREIEPYGSWMTADFYKRQHNALHKTYKNLKDEGDKNVYIFDAGDIIKAGGDHPSVDGVHLTDRGYYMIADKLAPFIQSILDTDK